MHLGYHKIMKKILRPSIQINGVAFLVKSNEKVSLGNTISKLKPTHSKIRQINLRMILSTYRRKWFSINHKGTEQCRKNDNSISRYNKKGVT